MACASADASADTSEDLSLDILMMPLERLRTVCTVAEQSIVIKNVIDRLYLCLSRFCILYLGASKKKKTFLK